MVRCQLCTSIYAQESQTNICYSCINLRENEIFNNEPGVKHSDGIYAAAIFFSICMLIGIYVAVVALIEMKNSMGTIEFLDKCAFSIFIGCFYVIQAMGICVVILFVYVLPVVIVANVVCAVVKLIL
jgi:hypothetical protein